ncbi:MAG TPA: hypothetical protein VMV54_02725, partial [Acidocella sp.]|nr:hypothetical protein [Acidocella sp.]
EFRTIGHDDVDLVVFRMNIGFHRVCSIGSGPPIPTGSKGCGVYPRASIYASFAFAKAAA